MELICWCCLSTGFAVSTELIMTGAEPEVYSNLGHLQTLRGHSFQPLEADGGKGVFLRSKNDLLHNFQTALCAVESR